jgi:SAM-dependent methyltransferase
MATLLDIVSRAVPPVPWTEGENIPWDDPAFSERMLAEHLTDRHDLASRRSAVIDRQVAWIQRQVPRDGTVLDLACGPGLYLNRLARRGRSGVGIDFSPASLRHARHVARSEELPVHYVQGDIRSTDFGGGFDLVLLLYGQLNVFWRSEAEDIVRRAATALVPGGRLIVEIQTHDAVRAGGDRDSTSVTHQSGLFSDRPHLLLSESHWDEEAATTTERFHVIDGASASVTSHAMSTVAYREGELTAMFERMGVPIVATSRSLSERDADENLFVLIGRRPVNPPS